MIVLTMSPLCLRSVSTALARLGCPAVQLGDDLYPLLRKVVGALAVLAPGARIGARWGDAASGTGGQIHNQLARIAQDRNPYSYEDRLYVMTGYTVMAWVKHIEENICRLTTPFIVLHGDMDKMVDISSTELLVSRAPARSEFVKLKGEMHGFMNDYNRAQCMAHYLRWLDSSLNGGDHASPC
eukprot:m51a1_g14696 hypothetical protein (183) ;mRNA; r:113888-114644